MLVYVSYSKSMQCVSVTNVTILYNFVWIPYNVTANLQMSQFGF